MGDFPFDPNPALALQATTATANPTGYALVNGTGTVISWTTPNDGQNHRWTIAASLHVTSLETGGLVQQQGFLPDGTTSNHTLFAASAGAGEALAANPGIRIAGPNTVVSVIQASALTGGAAVMWAEIWGS